MGKALDVVLIVIVLIGALYLAHKFGITAGEIWTWTRTFFSGGSSGTNSTLGMVKY